MNPPTPTPIAGVDLGQRTLIIAELSANHQHRYETAVELVHAAKAAGADAVKVQTYTAETITLDCDSEPFQIRGTLWEGRTLHDLYREAYMPWEWQPKLKAVADELGIAFFSSPFDPTSVDFLEEMGVPAYKIASPEIVDIPLIRRVARTGKPVVISTGMASLEEIGDAVEAAREEGAGMLVLLKCTSAYPAPPEEMNLRTIADMAARFGVPVGLSDHTLEIAVPVAAVAMGARVIEKHFTLSRADGGPDSAFSLEPAEFRSMVDAVRTAEKALGTVSYEVTPREAAGRPYRRSLFAVEDVRSGQLFTTSNVRSIRPGQGLPPKELDSLLGRTAAVDIARGTPLSWELVSDAGAGAE